MTEAQSCASRLHTVRNECSLYDRQCLQKKGIYRSRDDCPCEAPTVCVVSGESEPIYVCPAPGTASRTVEERVYGLPMRGVGHVRLVRE